MARLPEIVCIGSGNLAHHFMIALHRKKYIIRQVISKNLKNAKRLANQLNAEASSSLNRIHEEADVYFLLVPDEHIKEVSEQIFNKISNKDTIMIHCSGATDINTISKKSANNAVMWPLQTFKKDKHTRLRSTPILVEGSNSKSLKKVKALARKISTKVIECDSQTRLKYHLGAVLVNNFVNHLFCKTKTYFDHNNLDWNMLLPIIDQTVKSINDNDPCLIQTGPAKRGDIATMKKHTKLLKENKEFEKLYRLLSESIIKNYQ